MPKSEAPRFCASDEFRVINGPSGRPRIVGYAARFESLSQDLGGFRERIKAGAFDDALADPAAEVLALMNHDTRSVLGRRSAGTLTVRADKVGLYVEIDPPNTTVGNDALENIRRKDIKGMSFRFPRGAKDSWAVEDGENVRTLHKVGLMEVSCTAIPAYESTSVELRALGEDDEVRGYYGAKLAELNPAADVEQRLRLAEAEARAYDEYGNYVYGPADQVRGVIDRCRSAFDGATAALTVIAEGDAGDADLQLAIADAAMEADKAIERLTEFAAACRGGGATEEEETAEETPAAAEETPATDDEATSDAAA